MRLEAMAEGRVRRVGHRIGAWLGAALALVAAAERGLACAGPETSDRIRRAGPDGIALASGREVRPVDLRLAETGPPAAAVASWLGTLADEDVLVAPVGEPDRWGRVAARLRVGTRSPVDFAEMLVGEGLAIVDAGPRDALCDPALLAVEATARRGRRGLWGLPDWPIAARDVERLAAATGRFAVVEGRVASVGERRDRTYLNFGRDFARDFSVTLSRRTWAGMKARGTTVATLTGRRVRVRGLVEMRRAPTIDIVAPDMVEALDATPGIRQETP